MLLCFSTTSRIPLPVDVVPFTTDLFHGQVHTTVPPEMDLRLFLILLSFEFDRRLSDQWTIIWMIQTD